MSDVIPFGKYKGQPVEVMLQDKNYVDWITAQPWFREKFANIYTLIVNNFQEPAETPAHNKLQALFLDVAFRLNFIRSLGVDVPDTVQKTSVAFERDGFDVLIYYDVPAQDRHDRWTNHKIVGIEIKPQIGDDYPAVLRQMRAALDAMKRVQEYGAQYVRMHQQIYEKAFQGKPVLFLEEYIGTGATEEQFIEIFETAGIRTVFLDEVA